MPFKMLYFQWRFSMDFQSFICIRTPHFWSIMGLTTLLGKDACYFTEYVCEQLPAGPLAKELAARRRQQWQKAQSTSQRDHSRSPPPSRSTSHQRQHHSQTWSNSSPSPHRKQKYFNMYTYKWHALGHYTYVIRKYGTLDLVGTPKVCSLLWFISLISLS